jgi:hypothetical protein
MAKDECPLGGDRMLLGPEQGDGSRPCVRHLPDHRIQTGFVKPLRDGQPINGFDEVFAARYDPQHGDYEVKSIYDQSQPPTGAAQATSKGPAKVTSNAYRAGYDRIFGKQTVGSA